MKKCDIGTDRDQRRYSFLYRVVSGELDFREAAAYLGVGRTCEGQWGFMESGSDARRCDPDGGLYCGARPSGGGNWGRADLQEALRMVEEVGDGAYEDLTPAFRATRLLWKGKPSKDHTNSTFGELFHLMFGEPSCGFVSFGGRA